MLEPYCRFIIMKEWEIWRVVFLDDVKQGGGRISCGHKSSSFNRIKKIVSRAAEEYKKIPYDIFTARWKM